MNAQVQATLPADTKTAVLEAVEQGVSDARQAATAQEESAAANAAELIARIPTLVREATADGLRRKISRFRATLMPIGVDDCSEYLKTTSTDALQMSYVNRATLVGTAGVVWDHCVAAGLHVFVARTREEGESYYKYSLDIAWSLPESQKPADTKKKGHWLERLTVLSKAWRWW
jgi:hypothetical protein